MNRLVYFYASLLVPLLLAAQAPGPRQAARQRALLVGRWQARDVYAPDTAYVTLVFYANGTGSMQSSRFPTRPPAQFAYAVPAPNRLQLVRRQQRTTHYIHALTGQQLQLGPPPEREKFAEIMETLNYRRVSE